MEVFPLTELPIGQSARIMQLLSTAGSRRRMLDLGLVVSSVVEAVRKSPAGDPTAYRVRGAVIALRREEAAQILVRREPS
ncbi:MAG TPA: FeoA family protein [Bacilli bacterium]|nr:FeoA family protein [Bacilli bacterium]